jgi:hypothetical protein
MIYCDARDRTGPTACDAFSMASTAQISPPLKEVMIDANTEMYRFHEGVPFMS